MVILTSGQRNLTKGRIGAPHMDAIPYTLQWVAPPSFIKFPSVDGGCGPPSNTRFVWLTRVHNAKRISIGSAVLAKRTIVA